MQCLHAYILLDIPCLLALCSSDQTLVITVAMSLSPTCVEYLYRHTVSPNIARRCGYVDSRQETTMYQVVPPSSGSVLKIKYHQSTQASEMSSCFSSTLPYLRARSTSPVGQWINPAGPQQRKSFNFENLATLPSLYNSTASSYRSLSTEPELIRQVLENL